MTEWVPARKTLSLSLCCSGSAASCFGVWCLCKKRKTLILLCWLRAISACCWFQTHVLLSFIDLCSADTPYFVLERLLVLLMSYLASAFLKLGCVCAISFFWMRNLKKVSSFAENSVCLQLLYVWFEGFNFLLLCFFCCCCFKNFILSKSKFYIFMLNSKNEGKMIMQRFYFDLFVAI